MREKERDRITQHIKEQKWDEDTINGHLGENSRTLDRGDSTQESSKGNARLTVMPQVRRVSPERAGDGSLQEKNENW